MKRQKMLGLGGILLVFISLFTPVLSIPVVGSVNLLHYNVPAAVFTVLLCGVSLFLVIKEHFLNMLYASLSLLVLMIVLFINVYIKIESVKADMTKDLEGNIFAGLASAMAAAIRLEWGWALLFIGLGLLIAAALIKTPVIEGESSEEGQAFGRWVRSTMSFKQVSMPNWAWVSVLAGIMIVASISFGGMRSPSDVAGSGKGGLAVNSQRKVPDSVLQAYIASSMEITDLKASLHDSVLDGKVPGVEFRVNNKGDKPLKRVEVTVYFKDKDGKVINEQKYTPITQSGMDGGKLLKPNYIWQLERRKFYNAKSVPSEWSNGAVDAKITAIEFADERDLVPDIADNSPERQYAKNNIEIYEVKNGMYNSILDGRLPGIEFKVKNKGDKSLNELAVTAYFKDKAGNIIYEEEYFPVSSNSFDGAKVLKAGQIWQLEKGKFYTAGALPTEWDGASAVLEVTKIKFE